MGRRDLLRRADQPEESSAGWSGVRYHALQYGHQSAAFESHPHVRYAVREYPAGYGEESGYVALEEFRIRGEALSADAFRGVQCDQSRDLWESEYHSDE